MYAKLFEVKETGGKGKGLFAKQFIPKGTIPGFECDKCEILLGIDPSKMSEKEKDELFLRAYRKQDGSFVAPCDDSRYMNHSCDANILDSGRGFDLVVRDIQKGEEASFDYRGFYDDLNMPCQCGSKNCCKIVTCAQPIPEDLARFWAKRATAALNRVHEVPQPLKEELKQKSIFLPLAKV
ncbi:MAG: SET domain-containing protein-lysine N-methyltransferase [Candidatus Omnitrophota bacterium]